MPEGLGERVFRVFTLEGDVFSEVAEEESSTGVALIIVFGTALAQGLGRLPEDGIRGMLLGAAEGCLRWSLLLVLIQVCLTALGRTDRLGPLFRALGFAAAPFALVIFAGIPLLGSLATIAAWLLGFGAAWRATQRAGRLAVPEAGIVCAAALFTALWLSSVLLRGVAA